MRSLTLPPLTSTSKLANDEFEYTSPYVEINAADIHLVFFLVVGQTQHSPSPSHPSATPDAQRSRSVVYLKKAICVASL